MDLSLDIDDFREPEVPAELIRYVCGHDDLDEFLRSGSEVVFMFRLALMKYFQKEFNELTPVLDFGCGCGRILRFLKNEPIQIQACDVGRLVAEFAAESCSFADVHRNELAPPLRYSDESFQLVYAFSVFSHLPWEVEKAWLSELVRVGRPGCVYLFSIHGDWFIEQTLSSEEQQTLRDDGFWWKEVHGRSALGAKLDFPKDYEASYHTSDFVRSEWGKYFEIVDVVKGDDPARYLPQGWAFEPEGGVSRFRPMGQDLVVARKRTDLSSGRSAIDRNPRA